MHSFSALRSARRLTPFTRLSQIAIQTPRRFYQITALPYGLEGGLHKLFKPESLREYYENHHQSLIQQLSILIRGTEYENRSLLEMANLASRRQGHAAIFNYASQIWNEEFFLHTLTPAEKPMLADVEARILENFNSVDIFKMQFKNQALATFGSGWVWLVETTQRQMRIINTFNAGSPNIPGAAHLAYISMPLKELPKTEGSEAVVETTNPYLQIEEMYRPILALSVWEHAYMRDHGVNGREAYIDAFWDAVDWDVVRQRLFPGKPANTSSLGY